MINTNAVDASIQAVSALFIFSVFIFPGSEGKIKQRTTITKRMEKVMSANLLDI